VTTVPPSAAPLFGPLLTSFGQAPGPEGGHALAAVIGMAPGVAPPALQAAGQIPRPQRIDRLPGADVWRWLFTLPPEPTAGYLFGGRRIPVQAALAGDLRVGFVSCNGKEAGDLDRPDRDALWDRLAADHARAPLSLLLHGGDQIYADAGLQAHPALAAWAAAPARRRGRIPADPEAEAALTAFFLARWLRNVTAPAPARLMAQVPGLAMWDDHDIFDGYGSHPLPVQQGPMGRMVYRVARRFYRLFQAGGAVPPAGVPLGFARRYPGLTILAPDLRSERRPDRVMGPAGWAQLERALAATPAGDRVLMISTVPALGPRLSLLEGLHRLVPGAQKYEDDLRDQWQSRAHRAEWRRLLTVLGDHTERTGPVTLLSGEIHLATRGEMRLGDRVLHQLIASGISHPPPPRGFARALGALSALGEAPLPHRPITLHPLPGQRRVYAAQRNYLLLFRRGGAWSAAWELESQGRTPPLAL